MSRVRSRWLVALLSCAALPALPATASDPGNVLRAARSGPLLADVLLDYGLAPPGNVRISRDVAKTALGVTTLVASAAPPRYPDAGAVLPAAGPQLFYQIETLTSPCQSCASYATPVNRGPVGEPALAEASGIAASRDHPGVLWLHNDSGDSARFFALASDGSPLGEFRLAAGAANVDWEDIALGPCPTGTCIYLGDHGDNNAARTDCAVYRVPEPVVEVGGPVGIVIDVPFERFPFSYPDGPRDAEALMVHPTSGDVYVVSKIAGPFNRGAIYKFPRPLVPDVMTTLTRLADLPQSFSFEWPVTAGDIHPCESRLLLRTHQYAPNPPVPGRIFQATLTGGGPFDDIFTSGTWTTVPSMVENQGEAVGWSGDGRGYYTASEGAGEPIWYIGCQ